MRLVLLLPVAVALAACSRPPGGRDGSDGRSCTVTSGEQDRAIVTCDDGAEAVQPDIQGAPGADAGPGPKGPDGENGHAALLGLASIDPGPECPGGGARIETGQDRNDDGAIGSGEGDAPVVICGHEPPCHDPETGERRLRGDLRLRDELDLRRFQLSGCTIAGGRLQLGGDALTSLFSDMSALASLRQADGDVEIARVVGSLAGLSGLREIQGSLWIHDSILHGLSGLQGLEVVMGDVVLGCGLPLDTAELPALRLVGGDLRVARAEWAAQIHATVRGQTRIEECPR